MIRPPNTPSRRPEITFAISAPVKNSDPIFSNKIRITIGSKALAEGSVEFKLRRDGRAKAALVKIEDVAEKCLAAAKG